MKRAIEFTAIVLMALALIPGGAHLFALPGKIGLDRDAYFAVQQIYAGWAYFGVVLFAAIIANAGLAVSHRGDPAAFAFALVGLAAMLLNLAIFFAWTFPANQATANWTVVPDNWDALRRQWEYSHAANALVTFLGFCAVTLAALAARR